MTRPDLKQKQEVDELTVEDIEDQEIIDGPLERMQPVLKKNEEPIIISDS